MYMKAEFHTNYEVRVKPREPCGIVAEGFTTTLRNARDKDSADVI